MTRLPARGWWWRLRRSFIAALRQPARFARKTIQPGFARGNAPLLVLTHHFPRRGKFSCHSSFVLIRNSKIRAAKISPSGGDVAAGDRRGAFPSRRRRGFSVFPPKGQPTIGRPLNEQARGQLRLTWKSYAGFPQHKTPSEPARSVGGTHGSAQSARTIESGHRRRRNPPAFGNTASRRPVFTGKCLTYGTYRNSSLCGDPAEGLQVSRSWPSACP